MKGLAGILLFYISFLIFEPGITNMYSAVISQEEVTVCDNHCCHKAPCDTKKESSENRKPYKCCSDGVCNLFTRCGCCLGFCVEVDNLPFIDAIRPGNFSFALIQNIQSDFYKEFFHPPDYV